MLPSDRTIVPTNETVVRTLVPSDARIESRPWSSSTRSNSYSTTRLDTFKVQSCATFFVGPIETCRSVRFATRFGNLVERQGVSGGRFVIRIECMKIQKALITAAGPGQNALPLQRLVDRDGIEKTALEMIIEEVDAAGIDSIAIVIRPGDKPLTNKRPADILIASYLSSSLPPRVWGCNPPGPLFCRQRQCPASGW